ncbi:hypothetical protein BDY19DRAFT_945542 [Irpex rosettiformis]|uniref:Uncharacterized protein n=1 Tax=Irpex rosettiformis TaxID=378272 RepID=A0ACB8U4Y5_9APHY|nr:hypothetical protein BDY19DRAFT_945542 [Irpex rosettiformis]
MLNSLRSTLSRQTIISFFSGFDKSTESALTMNEGIQCLETELCCPTSEKKRINPGESTECACHPLCTCRSRVPAKPQPQQPRLFWPVRQHTCSCAPRD